MKTWWSPWSSVVLVVKTSLPLLFLLLLQSVSSQYSSSPYNPRPDRHQNPPAYDRSRRYPSSGSLGYYDQYEAAKREGLYSSSYPKEDKEPEYDSPHLRTSPLTAARNKTNLGLVSKWGGDKKEIGPKSNIESSLAAIFRGVAYGVSTPPTTTTTTTSTTTSTSTTSTTITPVIVDPNPTDVNNEREYDPEKNNPPQSGYHTNRDEFRPKLYPTSEPPFISPTEVGRAGLDDWQSSLEGAWEVHVYCSAASFSILALIALLCLVRFNMSNYLLPRGYYITAHLLVFLSSFFRCVLFFHDPYASEQKLPVVISEILFNTGIPCMTAAFSIVVLALLNSARIILLPLNLQSPLCFGIISGIYITASIAVDIFDAVFHQEEWTGVRASVQALTAGWTAAMCLGYMIIFYRIEKVASRHRNDIIRVSYGRENIETLSLPRRISANALSRAARLILVASFCGITVAVLKVYGLMTPNGLVHLPPREPWIWFGFQTSCRLLEIIMWSCICVAAALSSCSSLDKQTGDDQSLTVFSCKNCTSCSDISSCQEVNGKKMTEEIYPNACHSNIIARNYTVDVNGKMIDDGRTLPRLTNTIGPRDRDKTSTAKKTSTLHSATSDMHLLWGGQYSNSSTSRPASMIFNDNGMVRFRTQVEGNEYQDVLSNHYGNNELPPGYSEHVYNMSQHRKNDLISDSNDPSQLQSLLHNKIPSSVYDSSRVQNNSTPSDANTEYNYAELPNDEYGRYASACSSVSAANSFDVRMYDDYEVASYYHSPMIGPKSNGSHHVYASLRPTPPNFATNRYPPRNMRVSNNNSCFSSPQSVISSVHTNQSPRISNHHTSDSDLCSSATDRTIASSSQGNDDSSGRYDNINVNFCRPQMRRHLSHPNAMPDNDEAPSNYSKRTATLDFPDNRYSPTNSDDIYTPLMDQQQQYISPVSSPTINQCRPILNKSRLPPQSLVSNQNPSKQQFSNIPNIQTTVQNSTTSSNVPSNKTPPHHHPVLPSAHLSPKRSTPTSPVSPLYLNNQVDQQTFNSDQFNNKSSTAGAADTSSPPYSQRISQTNSNLNSSSVEDTSKRPPPVPHRPSLESETWVHQTHDGMPRTEFVRKGSRKGNNRSGSTSPSSSVTVTNI